MKRLTRKAARTWPVPFELARLVVASVRYGRQEAREQTAAPLPPLDQMTDDRVAADAALQRKWTRWM